LLSPPPHEVPTQLEVTISKVGESLESPWTDLGIRGFLGAPFEDSWRATAFLGSIGGTMPP
jgi:hypothetical protein